MGIVPILVDICRCSSHEAQDHHIFFFFWGGQFPLTKSSCTKIRNGLVEIPATLLQLLSGRFIKKC